MRPPNRLLRMTAIWLDSGFFNATGVLLPASSSSHAGIHERIIDDFLIIPPHQNLPQL